MKNLILSLWNSTFAKILRWIMFIPMYFVSLLIIYRIYFFGVETLNNITFSVVSGTNMSSDFIFGFLIFSVILFVGSFSILPKYSLYTIKICPDIRVGVYIYTMMIILEFGMFIYYQVMNEMHLSILKTFGIIILNAGFYWGVIYAKKEIK